jgi:hypothetical protein
MQDDVSEENERLRKHILSLLDEHVELRKEIRILKNGSIPSNVPDMGQQNQIIINDQIDIDEYERLKADILKESEKSRLLLTRYSKELNEEERLIRAMSALQNSYDKLSFRYECLATSPLGKIMVRIWEINNKIRRDSARKER